MSELNALGRFCLFDFNSSSPHLIQGAAYIEPRDSDDEKKAKNKRSRYAEYIGRFSHLNPLDFEALCAGILNLIGVDKPALTAKSGDEGIDFYGPLKLESWIGNNPVFSTFIRQMTIWLIGQAKHYSSSKVATPELRELVGSIQLARSSTYASLRPKLDSLLLRICDPVYYLFFTTGYISADGWRLIKRSGIIGMDGEMIAAFLADNEVGIKNNQFDSDKFHEWIQSYAQ